MDDIVRYLTGLWKTNPLIAKIAYTLAIVIAITAARTVAHRVIWKKTDDVHARYTALKVSANAMAAIALISVGLVWISDWRQVVTYLGLVSAGIAIALKELISDVAGWLFILSRRPFVTGDRIEIGGTSGDVVDIRMFQFTVLEIGNWVRSDQSTGRVIHIPNGAVFTQQLANYTRGFEYIWNEIPVLITFESDWKRAKRILQSIVESYAASQDTSVEDKIREASKRYLIVYANLKPIVYTRIEESGVLLTLRYLCNPRKRRDSENTIHEAILAAFSGEAGIDFAYPTRRILAESGLPSESNGTGGQS